MSTMTLEQVRDWHATCADTFEYNGESALADQHRKLAAAISAHLAQPAQAVDVVGYCTHDEFAKLLKRKGEPGHNFAAIEVWNKPFLSSIPITRALGNAQAEGWKVPEGLVLLPIDPTEKMVEAICRAHARASVWPSGFDPTAQRIRRESATRGYRAAIAHASVGAE